MPGRLDYYFRETVGGLRRNGLVAFAAVSTVFISLFLFGGALLIGRQIDLVLDFSTQKVEVAVFLTDGISGDQQRSIHNILAGMPEVADFTYESKEEAYRRFLDLFENQPALVDNVSKDALPASFRVKLTDPEQNIDSIKARLAGQPGIENITDQREVLDRLFAVSRVLRLGAFIAAAVMLVSAVALIANTVRMAVFARRKEIGIMRLVGATNWFIRVPFMIEGLVEGILGAAFAIVGLKIMTDLFFNSISKEIGFFPIVSGADLMFTIPIILGMGVAVALVASFIAMRRFLEV